MGNYDDVSNFCNEVYSPTSTISTSSSSGSASPVYENVEELTGLCSRSWKMQGKRNSKPSMTDFLAQIPPPPPVFEEENGNFGGGGGFIKRSSLPTSTSSSRRPIIASPSSSSSSSSESPPPPSPIVPPVSSSSESGGQCRFDMRPLSLPHKEMQRIEREQSHRVLIITLLIITILILLIALCIYIYYDAIAAHINNISY